MRMADNLTLKLTKKEYVMGSLDALVNGLKSAIGFWSAYLLTVFLKFSTENYTKVSLYLTIISFATIPLAYLIARFTDRVKNLKRFAGATYVLKVLVTVIMPLPLFYFFPGISDTYKIIFVVITNIFSSIIGSFNSNAWSLLDIRLTANDKERSYLYTIRNLIVSATGSLGAPTTWIVVFLFRALIPTELDTDGVNAHIYFYGTIFFALLAMPVTLYYLKIRYIRIPTPPRKKPENIRFIAKSMIRNKPLVFRRVSMVIGAWAGLSGSAFALLVSKYYYGVTITILGWSFVPDIATLTLIFSCTQTIPSVLSIPVGLWLRKKVSDKSLLIFSDLYNAAGMLIAFFFLADVFFPTALYQRFFIQLAAYGWGGLTFGLNICGHITDLELIDYTEWQSGHRNECTYNFILDIFNKVLTLPIGYIAALLLIRAGYQTDSSDMVSEQTRKGLVTLMLLVPAFFRILATVPMYFYDFTGKRRQTIMDELRLRRTGDKKENQWRSAITDEGYNLYK